jgi:RHS repeat-associated protein
MAKRKRVLGVLGVLALLGLRLSAEAQTCVKHGVFEGCDPSYQPQQCFPVVGGPSSWQDPSGNRTWQFLRSLQSPRNTCEPALGTSIPNCCGGQPHSTPAPIISVRLAGTRILVDYDAPNFYCTDAGDWPPGITCFNDPFADGDHLSIYRGTEEFPDDTAFIYFEHGTWDTGIDLACGTGAAYRARIQYVTDFGSSVSVESGVVPLQAPANCPDRHPCPTSVADPINVGSGDVTFAQPLFTVGQEPLPLPFTLTYHSSTPMFSGLVSSPVGVGWTHEYAQTLRTEDGTTNRLYHITGEGFEHEYLRIAPDNYWIAISPAELRGTIKQVASEYQLTDLGGTVTSFDVATGNWNSTKDRWANTISGTYSGGQLTAITDSMGRQIQLSYTAGQVTITLPDGSTWRLILGAGGNLTQIFDPLHTGAVPWRAFSYQNDHAGVLRLLTSAKDEANQELQGYTYQVTTDRGLTSSQAGGTKSNVGITYTGNNTRTVTHTIDGSTQQTTNFTVSYLRGHWLPNQITGSCSTCAGSGADLQSFTYDYSNNVIDKKDGSGADQAETTYSYNGNGMVLARTDVFGKPEQRTKTYTYNYSSGTPSGGAPWPSFVTSMTETSVAKPGQNKTTAFSWNASGTPETALTTLVSGYLKSTDSSPTVYATTTHFETRHRRTEVDGPGVNQKKTFTYYPDADATPNRRGRLQQTSLFTSGTARLDTQFDDYDLFGPKKIVDPNGAETDKTTDPRGRATTVFSKKPPADPAEPADYTTTYSFDGRDRLTDVTQPRGNKLHYDYEDSTNRLTDTIRMDAAGNQQERLHLTMNAIGDRVQEEAQSCNTPAVSCATWTTRRTESFKYDTNNRLIEVDHPVPAGSKALYGYDTRGNLTRVQDERHSAANTTYAYDFLNRLTTVTQKQTLVGGPDVITLYAYDKQDNLISVTDPNSNVTTYSYDDFRRLQTQTSPVSGATNYSYDTAGNLTSTTDSNNAVTVRTYDAANRPTGATSTRSGLPTEAVTWTYDDATAGAYGTGRLASMSDPSGSSTYAYERRGLLRSESRTIEGNSYSQAYAYDANGNRSALTYPSGRRVDYTFDFADRPFSAVSGGTTYVSSASYAPFGPETQLSFGNGTTKTMTYDNRYRPSENKLTNGAGTIADDLYSEDALGNITSICAAQPCTTPSAAYDRVFVYDDLNRLTTANSGTSLWGAGSYAYDAMGNMTSLALGGRSVNFTYVQTGGHQTPKLATASDHTPPGVSYDAAGNETAVGGATYTYSTRNLLVSGDGPSYIYNGRGLRTVTTADTSFPSITSFAPTSGSAGTSVTITGTNLTGATAVKFNGTSATFTVDLDTQVTATVPAGATSGPISVTTPAGTATSAGSFTVGSTPTVTGFAPTSGPVGASVSIAGTGFTGATGVKFNGTSATSYHVDSDIQTTATVPGGATTGPISVTTPAGTGTSAGNFTVKPAITSFTPNSGAVGTRATITGTSFTSATAVAFNGTSATFTVDLDTQITATVPAGATTGPISVTTPAGTATSSGNFTVIPRITGFTPTSGAIGTSVMITGSSFTGATAVAFNGTSATFTVDLDTQITATVPAGATTGPISVTTPAGTATSSTNFTVTGSPTPTPTPPPATATPTATPAAGTPMITSFSPASGAVGTSVTINGTNLTGATSVTFNGTSSSFTVVSSIKITATVPANATTGPISVTAPGGTVASVGNFTVAPRITGFLPNSGAVGASVVITGANFTAATAVKFNGTSSSFTVNTATQITATVPANAATGPISVTTAAGTVTSAASFTVAPRITSFTPTSGPVGAGVTINGANFTGATVVRFNGTSATFTVNTAIKITATVPAGATTGLIDVTTPAGTATSATSFTVHLLPTIGSFTPAFGGVGASVTINGTNFTGITSVKFSGTAASFTVNTAIKITTTVPTNATTGRITLMNPAGTATSASDFIVAPRITSFSPTSGVIGSSVAVNGANFTGATAVTFNGISASFTVNTPVKITATVPAGATTGKIAATTSAGTAASTGNFTVKPNIISFTPTSGAVGISVTINGTAFTGTTSVRFNGTSATINSNNGTVIQTAVPANATTGKITVTTPGGTATSTTDFTVAPRITSFTPTSGAVGANVAINGANFTGTISVMLNGTSATFTVNSSVKITSPVPAGATTGKISVTTPAGTATSTGDFTVTGGLASASTPGGTNSAGTSEAEPGGGSVRVSEAHERFPVERVASLGLRFRGDEDHVRGFSSSGIRLFDGGWPASEDSGTAGSLGPAVSSDKATVAPRPAIKPQAAAAVGRRYSLYSPEMNLLAETEIKTTAGAPAILYEYVWFNGYAVAQIDSGTTTHWTFTDHLGTPLIQTDTGGAVYWRAEYEPYGKVFSLRTADQHQPIRLPGQEAEQLNLGPDGVTERSYNIFRWYRPAWGRYTQQDPVRWQYDRPTPAALRDPSPYGYTNGNPVLLVDPLGLVKWHCTYAKFEKGLLELGARKIMRGVSGKFGFAIVLDGFACTSDCACGRRVFANVAAGGAGLGLSLEVPFVGRDWSGSAGHIELEDSSACPDASSLQGGFLIASAGAQVGYGVECAHINLGSAHGGGCHGAWGLGIGGAAAAGVSKTFFQTSTKCCS